jgi:hypothetical protein
MLFPKLKTIELESYDPYYGTDPENLPEELCDFLMQRRERGVPVYRISMVACAVNDDDLNHLREIVGDVVVDFRS